MLQGPKHCLKLYASTFIMFSHQCEEKIGGICIGENLQQSIQMLLSKKPKFLSQFFALFVKSISNFESFEKKDDRHTLCISELQTVKGVVR